jgi:predicted dehydrogenase
MDEGLIRDFVICIKSGEMQAAITGEDGLRVLEVALAAYESSRIKAVVNLN